MKKALIPAIIASLALILAGWCAYALNISDLDLLHQTECDAPSVRLNAVNATRHLLHARTGAEIMAAEKNTAYVKALACQAN